MDVNGTLGVLDNQTQTNFTWSWTNFTEEPENSTQLCRNEYCVSDEEYVDLIIGYIFPTPLEWLLILAYLLIFIVGLVGNFLVCFAVRRNPSMRTVTNYFIVNLATADFLVILFCLPPTVLGDVTETWYMGRVMCKIVKYLQTVSVSVSVLTLTSISVERWQAICYPLKFKATTTRARNTILVIWGVSLTIGCPELVSLDVHARYPELTVLLTSCRPTWAKLNQQMFQFFLIVALYVLPFVLMFAAYFQIAICLWHNVIPTESSRDQLRPGESNHSYMTQLMARRKAAKMLIAVVLMFGICFLPVHLFNILRYAGVLKDNSSLVYFPLVAHWLCYFNSAINPVIYNFMSAKFRKEFRNVCLGGCRQKPRGYPTPSYSYRYTNTLCTNQTEKVTMSRAETDLTQC